VLISGEPGVGKSRLLAEISRRAAAEGWRVLRGRAYDIEGMPPYLPFIEILREHFRDLGDDEVTARVGAISPHLAPLILGARSDAQATRSTSSPEPERERYRLFESLCSLLLNISRSPPNRGLLLSLDDLHWADGSTLLLFMHLARKLGGMPLLAVGTYRSAEVAPERPIFDALAELSRERLHARLHLIGFSLDETKLFLRRLSGADAAGAIADSIFEQTGGNPFFVEELVRQLEGEGQDLAGRATDGAVWRVPEGVSQVIAKRLLRLSPGANRLLQAAAVLGDGCEGGPLAAVSDIGDPLFLAAVEEAMAAGMLHGEGHRYRFSHPLVQRTIYDSLSPPRRELLHLRAAKALEIGGSPLLHLSAMAVHYRLAGSSGDTEKAINYSVRAGEGTRRSRSLRKQAALRNGALRFSSGWVTCCASRVSTTARGSSISNNRSRSTPASAEHKQRRWSMSVSVDISPPSMTRWMSNARAGTSERPSQSSSSSARPRGSPSTSVSLQLRCGACEQRKAWMHRNGRWISRAQANRSLLTPRRCMPGISQPPVV